MEGPLPCFLPTNLSSRPHVYSCAFLPVMRPTTLLTLLALPVIALAATITSGQSYKITNSKGGTVVDLSAADNTSSTSSSSYSRMLLLTYFIVIGWPYHEGSNQQVRSSSFLRPSPSPLPS